MNLKRNRLYTIATALIVSGLSTFASAAPQYFTETFISGTVGSYPLGTKTGTPLTASTSSNLTISTTGGQPYGSARIYADNDLGGTGKVPAVKMFPSLTSNTFLNINGAMIGTKNGFAESYAAGGYDLNFQFTAKNALPTDGIAKDNPFEFGSTSVYMEVQLRESATGARDGIQLYFHSTGVEVLDWANGQKTNIKYYGSVGFNTTDVFDVKIRDTGTTITVFVNGQEKLNIDRSANNTNAGYIDLGTPAYSGVKYASISVTAVPEPASLSVVSGMGLAGITLFRLGRNK